MLDRKLVARTIEELGVEVIYHAAAYKHVPIVEANPFAGLQNNTFGTLVVAEAAKELGVERFVLVSSDKAVRPTNIMGASKRLAELILQACAAGTRFAQRSSPWCASAMCSIRPARWCGASATRSRRAAR